MGLFDWIRGRLGSTPPGDDAIGAAARQWLLDHGASRVDLDANRAEIRYSITGSEGLVNLRNLRLAVRQSPKPWREAVAQFMTAVAPATAADDSSYEAMRARLMPVVRRSVDLRIGERQATRLAGTGSSPAAIPHRPFAVGLVKAVVLDSPTTMSYLTQAQLDGWGVSFDDALSAALDNLRAATPEQGWVQLRPGIWAGQWNDSYESSRALISDAFVPTGLAQPVILVPFRNALLATSHDDAQGMRAMAVLAQESLDQNRHWLSPHMIRLPDLPCPVGDALGDDLLQLSMKSDEYAAQKAWLDEVHAEEGIDLFVASFKAVQRPDTGAFSYCVWSDDTQALLPQTDRVMFFTQAMQAESQTLSLDWNTVVANFGELMTPTTHEPVRWRVDRFPDMASLLKLAEAQASSP